MNMKIFPTGTLCLVVGCLLIVGEAFAQSKPIYDPKKGFYDYQSRMNNYFKKVGKVKTGYNQWKRIEWYYSTRLGSNGEIVNQQKFTQEALQQVSVLKAKQTELINAPNLVTGAWSHVGPTEIVSREEGIGRVNRLGFVNSQPNTIYAATAGGGLWKTTNGGSSWQPLTDGLPNSNISDVAVNQANTNIIYILTGDGDATSYGGSPTRCCGFGKYSTGVLKSTDGGVTWYPTGYQWEETDLRSDFKLLMHPTDFNTLYVAGNNGLYRTTNGGNSWIKLLDQFVYDVEFMPNNPQVIYAGVNGGRLYISMDGGSIWTPKFLTREREASRVSVAVSPDFGTAIYVLISNSADEDTTNQFYSFNGLYYSPDQGENWTKQASHLPNVFSGNGLVLDGRAETYAHSLAVSPTDEQKVITGAISIFKSSNGGTNLNIVDPDAGIYHVDVHDLIYSPTSNTLFAATDGGVYRSTNDGATWTAINNNLAITQYYRISTAPVSSLVVMGGSQDNGTHFRNSISSTFVSAPGTGGDGMDNAISQSNPSTMFASKQSGHIYRSTNSGALFSDFCNPNQLATMNIDVGGPWVTNIKIHPTNSNTVYVGYTSVVRAVTSGSSTTFTDIGNKGTMIVTGETILEICQSDPAVIYAGSNNFDGDKGKRIWRTNNGGNTWDTIVVPFPLQRFTKLAVNPGNPEEIWLTYGGYTPGGKVYYSDDGGKQWSNISGSLPNVPINCIIYASNDNLSSDPLYIGTDIGVFYRNNTLGDWIPFSMGLPVVEISDLEINHSVGLLRAGTYGRGIWETSLFTNNCFINLTFGPGAHPPSQPAFHTVTETISSSATIEGVGAHIEYKAGQNITLTPTFRVNGSTGAKFIAYIGPCPSGGVPPGYTAPTMNGLGGYLIENK